MFFYTLYDITEKKWLAILRYPDIYYKDLISELNLVSSIFLVVNFHFPVSLNNKSET